MTLVVSLIVELVQLLLYGRYRLFASVLVLNVPCLYLLLLLLLVLASDVASGHPKLIVPIVKLNALILLALFVLWLMVMPQS